MLPPDAQAAATEMEDILLLERSFLAAGEAREAAELSGRKLSALADFQALLESGAFRAAPQEARAQIERIADLAQENAALLEAVRNGLQSLMTRISRTGGSTYVGSYGQGGAQLAFPQATGGYVKRV
ncbi:MAG: hypothetical protein ACK46Q_01120 [Hyphomonas sp.]